MKNIIFCFTSVFLFVIHSYGQESPFGTGTISNQNIGMLDDASVVQSSPSGYGFNDFFPDAQTLLQDYNFDLYIPDDYDGSEAYGLVVFINSGNNGGVMSQWIDVLDDRKLIWVSGDQIGNPIFINIRMGVGMAAALRMQEIFNIDSNRIYTSGNSGGARMAHNLAFIYPETFKGAMPSCGGSYIRQVDQDYETQEPDGNYEAILNYPSDYIDYLLPFDQRFANMTSFNDFREGDIMNIYHNGSEVDGLKGKFLETAGSHCATTTAHFLDALNFVEHPFIEVIQDDFDGTSESSFILSDAFLADNTSDLVLNHNVNDMAQAQSKDLFLWNDPMGAILETAVQMYPGGNAMNTRFRMGIWSMTEDGAYCGFEGNGLKDGLPTLLLEIDFDEGQPTLTIRIENPSQPDMDILFASTFTDWELGNPLPIKYHLWDEEWRIELGAHLESPSTSIGGVRLLDDNRSVRIRWNDISTDFWNPSDWQNGAFITLNTEKIDGAAQAANLFVNKMELITADINVPTEIPVLTGMESAAICEGESYEFNNESLLESGTFTAMIVAENGCDSLVTLDLTVHPLPVVSITENNNIITADAGFQTYQWYFNGVVVDGATTASLEVENSGAYHVGVTDDNGCSNISESIDFINTSTTILADWDARVYPNPSQDVLFIDWNESSFEAELFDISGRSVMKGMASMNDVSHLGKGVYVLRIQVAEHSLTKLILKD